MYQFALVCWNVNSIQGVNTISKCLLCWRCTVSLADDLSVTGYATMQVG